MNKSKNMYQSLPFNYYLETIEEGLMCIAEILEKIEKLNNKLKDLKELHSMQINLKEKSDEGIKESTKKIEKIIVKILNSISDVENTYTILSLAYESMLNVVKAKPNSENDVQSLINLKERIIKARDVVENIIPLKSRLCEIINTN